MACSPRSAHPRVEPKGPRLALAARRGQTAGYGALVSVRERALKLRPTRNPSLSRAFFRADARTRTGDPFITSDGPMSAPVRSSHSGPLSMRLPPDWSGLKVTGEDNLVDGWWTSEMLSLQRTAPQTNDPLGSSGGPAGGSRGCRHRWQRLGQCPPQAYISSRGWLSCCASPKAVSTARLDCIQ